MFNIPLVERCGYGEKCRVRDPADLQTDVLARSFTLRSEFEGFTAETMGKFACRKYVDEESQEQSNFMRLRGGCHLCFDRLLQVGDSINNRNACRNRLALPKTKQLSFIFNLFPNSGGEKQVALLSDSLPKLDDFTLVKNADWPYDVRDFRWILLLAVKMY